MKPRVKCSVHMWGLATGARQLEPSTTLWGAALLGAVTGGGSIVEMLLIVLEWRGRRAVA